MSLEAQIRDLWGRIGNWNEGGIDRVQELAALLRDAGITTLDQIAVTPAQFEDQRGRMVTQHLDGLPSFVADPAGDVTERQQVAPGFWTMGGQRFGFLGDVNNDGSMGANRADVFQFDEANPMVGWSARGGGNTAYRLMQQPDGSTAIVPTWASSSDAEDVRNIGMLAAAVYGIPTMAAAAGVPGVANAAGASAPISTAGLSGAGSGLQSSLSALNATAAATPTTGGLTAMGGATGGGLTLGGVSSAAGGGLAGTGAGLGSTLPPATSLATTGLGTAQAGGGLLGTIGRGIGAVNSALGGNLGGLAGAALGAATSGDQTATSSREPWSAAQPWLRDMIQQGQQLSQQYRDNPFSSTQQQAYGNLFGLLNQFNTQTAPGLLSNINSMRVGGSPVGAPSMGMLNPTFRVGG